MRDVGIIVRPDARGATMLTIAPPLICGTEEIAELLLAGVDRVLDGVGRWLTRPGR